MTRNTIAAVTGDISTQFYTSKITGAGGDRVVGYSGNKVTGKPGGASIIINVLSAAASASGRQATVSVTQTTQAPAGPSSSYRYGQPYLFTSIQGLAEPARIAGGQDYSFVGVGGAGNSTSPGPTRVGVDLLSGWFWDNQGGDWIDSSLLRMGNVPWGSVLTPNAVNDVTYPVTVTTALQRVYNTGRWNAWVVRKSAGSQPRTVYARFASNVAFRPRIEVTYTDGTMATLLCRVSAGVSAGSTIPAQGVSTDNIQTGPAGGWLLEFERPAKAVQSATLYFTVQNHWSGAATIEFNLADPPVNNEPVGSGLAAAYPLDNGITANPAVIFSHRYQDGSTRRDFILQSQDNPIGSIDWGLRAPFNPVLWGGSPNTNKLPHVGLGKWIGGSNSSAGGSGDNDSNFNIVPSTYAGEGFKPLAPGLGALRIHMPPGKDNSGQTIVDGSFTNTGGPTIDARMFMPLDKMGLLREAWVRYYVFIDASYNPTLADKKHVFHTANTPTWTDMGGKWLIGFGHQTAYGGNSNNGGGGKGWSLRPEFSDQMTDMDPRAPQYRSYGMGLSWVDYTNNSWNPTSNPYGQPTATMPGYGVGHNQYTSLPRSQQEPGQRGGLMARLYPGRWYCIEEHIKLNAVDVPSSAGDGRNWTADGEVEWYLDGRLAYRTTGRVMRSLPTLPGDGNLREPFRELGINDLWMNFYHGGTTRNVYPRTYFVAGFCVAEQRVGPMNIPVPTWVPAAGGVAELTVANGGLLREPNSLALAYYGTFYHPLMKSEYSDFVLNPYRGSFGTYILHGGGHAGSNENTVTGMVPKANGIDFEVLNPGTPIFGNTSASQTQNAVTVLQPANYDQTWCEYVLDGKPASKHSWGVGEVVGPEHGGAAHGTFEYWVNGSNSFRGEPVFAATPHKMEFMAATGQAAWARAAAAPITTTGPMQPWIASCFVPQQNRTYVEANASGSTQFPRWVERNTGAFVIGTGAKRAASEDADSCAMFHVPSRNLLVFCDRAGGNVRVQVMDVSQNQPGWQLVSLSQALAVPAAWGVAGWCPDNNRIILGAIANDSAVYEVTIPTTIFATWQVTRRAFGVGQSIPSAAWSGVARSNTYGKGWVYNSALKAFVWAPYLNAPGNGPATVYVYRPFGT